MDNEFLIIGLTGPLGSGCSTIADFLSKDLNEFSVHSKSKLHDAESLIGEYYRYLKIDIDKYSEEEKDFNNKMNDIFINPKDLSDLIENHYKCITNSEDSKKLINRNLRKLLHIRDILNVFSNTGWNNFTIISMSTMMIKLMIENVAGESATDDNKYQFFKAGNVNEDMIEKIKDFAKNNIDKINQYNDYINNKNYSKLDCEEVDKLFDNINGLKSELKKNSDAQHAV